MFACVLFSKEIAAFFRGPSKFTLSARPYYEIRLFCYLITKLPFYPLNLRRNSCFSAILSQNACFFFFLFDSMTKRAFFYNPLAKLMFSNVFFIKFPFFSARSFCRIFHQFFFHNSFSFHLIFIFGFPTFV